MKKFLLIVGLLTSSLGASETPSLFQKAGSAFLQGLGNIFKGSVEGILQGAATGAVAAVGGVYVYNTCKQPKDITQENHVARAIDTSFSTSTLPVVAVVAAGFLVKEAWEVSSSKKEVSYLRMFSRIGARTAFQLGVIGLHFMNAQEAADKYVPLR